MLRLEDFSTKWWCQREISTTKGKNIFTWIEYANSKNCLAPFLPKY